MISRKNALSLVAAALMLLCTASSAFAATCTERLTAVQIELDGKVIASFPNGTWHVIASDTTAARSDRLSIAMAAFLSGKSVRLVYSGSSCTATDYGTVPNQMRIVE